MVKFMVCLKWHICWEGSCTAEIFLFWRKTKCELRLMYELSGCNISICKLSDCTVYKLYYSFRQKPGNKLKSWYNRPRRSPNFTDIFVAYYFLCDVTIIISEQFSRVSSCGKSYKLSLPKFECFLKLADKISEYDTFALFARQLAHYKRIGWHV